MSKKVCVINNVSFCWITSNFKEYVTLHFEIKQIVFVINKPKYVLELKIVRLEKQIAG